MPNNRGLERPHKKKRESGEENEHIHLALAVHPLGKKKTGSSGTEGTNSVERYRKGATGEKGGLKHFYVSRKGEKAAKTRNTRGVDDGKGIHRLFGVEGWIDRDVKEI